jgi:hypothetical protein
MAVDEKIQAALALEALPLPPSPRVEQIEAEYYVDSTGVDSLMIWVLLSDDTRDEEITGKNVMDIKAAIRESLLSHGVHLFPYSSLILRSDYLSRAESE